MCALGEFADIRLNAYPDRVFKGRISNIGPISIPTLRTAKVRLEVHNPGMMRLGMFVTATFHGLSQAECTRRFRRRRSCICTIATGSTCPAASDTFRRVEVAGGKMLPGNMQEILSGRRAGRASGVERAGAAEHGGAVTDE